jgi:hypothetical protein
MSHVPCPVFAATDLIGSSLEASGMLRLEGATVLRLLRPESRIDTISKRPDELPAVPEELPAASTSEDASSSSSRGGSGSMSAPPVYTEFDSYHGGSVPTYTDVTPLDSSSLSRGDVVVVHVVSAYAN